MSNQIKRPYPDNWPWGAPHKHPEGDTPPPFEGFNVEVPEEGTVMSNLAHSVREAKMALNSVVSVPAVFACDVKDGDIVIPLPCEDTCNVNCDELLKTLRDLQQIPDAIWIPAFRTSTDSQISTLSSVDPTTYNPPFYGVAYKGIKRVMVGPVVVHPRFKFHTGDKIYAGSDGDLTTTANEHMVGVCLAPGAIFLSQYASVLREAMKDLYDEATQDAKDNTIEKIEQEGLQGDNIKVTTAGATTERPLELHLGDIVNVKDFGAKGDGVTNDTNAFNAAIAHMQELGSNVCLFIPPGDYLVTTLPNVPCYGPGSVKYNNYLYSPFELLFKLNGAIQKDTNGRYKVDFTKMSDTDLAALIKQLLPSTGGGLTTDEDGKLVVDFTQMSVEELREMIESLLPDTGGGLTTDEDGKLVLDFSQLTPTQKEDLISQIVQEGGGLSVDENGQIYVDFESMPTDKFEAMLKSIRVPIWLDKNTTFYVDGTNGSDTIVEDIGTESKPFKTIQAAVYYVCDNYNVGRYVATIFIKNGTYSEVVKLPNFSRSTGHCTLQGESKHEVSIGKSSTNPGTTISASQPGYWHLKNLDITADNKLNTITGAYPTGIDATNGCIMYLEDVAVILEQIENVGDATVNRVRGICGTASTINIGTGCSINGVNTASVNKIFALVSYPDCKININYYDSAGDKLDISGDFATVASADGGGIARIHPKLPTIQGTATGKRYNTATGGYISTNGAGEEYFPGSINGTVGKNSWYE